MGCDIHTFTEYKRDGAWHCADRFEKSRYSDYEHVPGRFSCYSGRCYELFSFLANVRQGTWGNQVPVLAEPRGLPSDLSKRLRSELGDYHSLSYFTLFELKQGWAAHKDAIIKYDASVDGDDLAVQEWLKLPVETRPQPPSGYCASSSSPTAVNAQWSQPLKDIIGPMVGRIITFLHELHFDEDVKDTEVRIVFGFDS